MSGGAFLYHVLLIDSLSSAVSHTYGCEKVLLPLMQGTIWSLLLFGWRHWNRATQLSGQTVGARVRRWWYETNNWTLPGTAKGFKGKMGSEKLAREMGDVSLRFLRDEVWW